MRTPALVLGTTYYRMRDLLQVFRHFDTSTHWLSAAQYTVK